MRLKRLLLSLAISCILLVSCAAPGTLPTMPQTPASTVPESSANPTQALTEEEQTPPEKEAASPEDEKTLLPEIKPDQSYAAEGKGEQAGFIVTRFVVKEGSDRIITVVCPQCGRTFEQEYVSDRVYTCPNCATKFKGSPVYGSIYSNVAVIQNGVVFTPFRALWEDLGMTPSMSRRTVKSEPHCVPVWLGPGIVQWEAVSWAKEEVTLEEILLSKEGVSIWLGTQPPSNIISVNDEEHQMDAEPFTEDGILYVPLKDIVEPFGYNVQQESKPQSIIITR